MVNVKQDKHVFLYITVYPFIRFKRVNRYFAPSAVALQPSHFLRILTSWLPSTAPADPPPHGFPSLRSCRLYAGTVTFPKGIVKENGHIFFPSTLYQQQREYFIMGSADKLFVENHRKLRANLVTFFCKNPLLYI